jgi:hypothetical protein
VSTGEQGPRDPWWSRFGPIVLSTAKRRYWISVAIAWLLLGIALAAGGKFGLLWIPAIGLVGSVSVILRHRAGRRRLFGSGEGNDGTWPDGHGRT